MAKTIVDRILEEAGRKRKSPDLKLNLGLGSTRFKTPTWGQQDFAPDPLRGGDPSGDGAKFDPNYQTAGARPANFQGQTADQAKKLYDTLKHNPNTDPKLLAELNGIIGSGGMLGEQSTGWVGKSFGGLLEAIDTPRKLSMAAIADIFDIGDEFSFRAAAQEIITGRASDRYDEQMPERFRSRDGELRFSGSSLLSDPHDPDRDQSGAGKVSRAAGGFVLDFLFDPINWASFGTMGLGKAAALAGGRSAVATAGRESAEILARGGLLDETLDPLVRRVGEELIKGGAPARAQAAKELAGKESERLGRVLSETESYWIAKMSDREWYRQQADLARNVAELAPQWADNLTATAVTAREGMSALDSPLKAVYDDISQMLTTKQYRDLQTKYPEFIKSSYVPAHAKGGITITAPFMRQTTGGLNIGFRTNRELTAPVRGLMKALYNRFPEKMRTGMKSSWMRRSTDAADFDAYRRGGAWNADTARGVRVNAVRAMGVSEAPAELMSAMRGLGEVAELEGMDYDEVWDVMTRMLDDGWEEGTMLHEVSSAPMRDAMVEAADLIRVTMDTVHGALKKLDPDMGYIENYVPMIASKDFLKTLDSWAENGVPIPRVTDDMTSDQKFGLTILAEYLAAVDAKRAAGGVAGVHLESMAYMNPRNLGKTMFSPFGDEGTMLLNKDSTRALLYDDDTKVGWHSRSVVNRAVKAGLEFMQESGAIKRLDDALEPFSTDLPSVLNSYVVAMERVISFQAYIAAGKQLGLIRKGDDVLEIGQTLGHLGEGVWNAETRKAADMLGRWARKEQPKRAPLAMKNVEILPGWNREIPSVVAADPKVIRALASLREAGARATASGARHVEALQKTADQLVDAGVPPELAQAVAAARTDPALREAQAVLLGALDEQVSMLRAVANDLTKSASDRIAAQAMVEEALRTTNEMSVEVGKAVEDIRSQWIRQFNYKVEVDVGTVDLLAPTENGITGIQGLVSYFDQAIDDALEARVLKVLDRDAPHEAAALRQVATTGDMRLSLLRKADELAENVQRDAVREAWEHMSSMLEVTNLSVDDLLKSMTPLEVMGILDSAVGRMIPRGGNSHLAEVAEGIAEWGQRPYLPHRIERVDPADARAIAVEYQLAEQITEEGLASFSQFHRETLAHYELLKGDGVRFVPTDDPLPYARFEDMLAEWKQTGTVRVSTAIDANDAAVFHDPRYAADGMPLGNLFDAMHKMLTRGAHGGYDGVAKLRTFDDSLTGIAESWLSHGQLYSDHARGQFTMLTRGRNTASVQLGQPMPRKVGVLDPGLTALEYGEETDFLKQSLWRFEGFGQARNKATAVEDWQRQLVELESEIVSAMDPLPLGGVRIRTHAGEIKEFPSVKEYDVYVARLDSELGLIDDELTALYASMDRGAEGLAPLGPQHLPGELPPAEAAVVNPSRRIRKRIQSLVAETMSQGGSTELDAYRGAVAISLTGDAARAVDEALVADFARIEAYRANMRAWQLGNEGRTISDGNAVQGRAAVQERNRLLYATDGADPAYPIVPKDSSNMVDQRILNDQNNYIGTVKKPEPPEDLLVMQTSGEGQFLSPAKLNAYTQPAPTRDTGSFIGYDGMDAGLSRKDYDAGSVVDMSDTARIDGPRADGAGQKQALGFGAKSAPEPDEASKAIDDWRLRQNAETGGGPTDAFPDVSGQGAQLRAARSFAALDQRKPTYSRTPVERRSVEKGNRGPEERSLELGGEEWSRNDRGSLTRSEMTTGNPEALPGLRATAQQIRERVDLEVGNFLSELPSQRLADLLEVDPSRIAARGWDHEVFNQQSAWRKVWDAAYDKSDLDMDAASAIRGMRNAANERADQVGLGGLRDTETVKGSSLENLGGRFAQVKTSVERRVIGQSTGVMRALASGDAGMIARYEDEVRELFGMIGLDPTRLRIDVLADGTVAVRYLGDGAQTVEKSISPVSLRRVLGEQLGENMAEMDTAMVVMRAAEALEEGRLLFDDLPVEIADFLRRVPDGRLPIHSAQYETLRDLVPQLTTARGELADQLTTLKGVSKGRAAEAGEALDEVLTVLEPFLRHVKSSTDNLDAAWVAHKKTLARVLPPRAYEQLRDLVEAAPALRTMKAEARMNMTGNQSRAWRPVSQMYDAFDQSISEATQALRPTLRGPHAAEARAVIGGLESFEEKVAILLTHGESSLTGARDIRPGYLQATDDPDLIATFGRQVDEAEDAAGRVSAALQRNAANPEFRSFVETEMADVLQQSGETAEEWIRRRGVALSQPIKRVRPRVKNEGGYVSARQVNVGGLDDYEIEAAFAVTLESLASHVNAMFTPLGVRVFSDQLAGMERWWKAAVTVGRPTFVPRALLGGTFNGMIADTGVREYQWIGSKALRVRSALGKGERFEDAIRFMRPEDQQTFLAARDFKIFDTKFTHDIADPMMGKANHSVNPFAGVFGGEKTFVGFEMGGQFMARSEDFQRMAVFKRWYDPNRPETALLAQQMAFAVHFDYTSLTVLETRFKKLVPFYVWSRRNIPLQIRTLVERPGIMNRHQNLLSNAEEGFRDGEQDFADRQPTPSWMGRMTADLDTTWDRGDGHWAKLNWTPDFPTKDLVQILQMFEDDGIVGGAASWFGQTLTPLIGTPLEVAFGDEYRDRTYDQAPVGIAAVLNALESAGLWWGETKGDKAVISLAQRDLIEEVIPFWREWTETAGIVSTSAARAAKQGVRLDDGVSTQERAGAAFLGVSKAFGLRATTPQDSMMPTMQANQRVKEIENLALARGYVTIEGLKHGPPKDVPEPSAQEELGYFTQDDLAAWSDRPVEPASMVIDGDTFKITLPDGTVERVRLLGIDTPEKGVLGAAAAKRFVEEAFEAGGDVRLVRDVVDRDVYGRLLRYVWVGDRMINLELVQAGLADSRSYSPNRAFERLLDGAAEMARG